MGHGHLHGADDPALLVPANDAAVAPFGVPHEPFGVDDGAVRPSATLDAGIFLPFAVGQTGFGIDRNLPNDLGREIGEVRRPAIGRETCGVGDVQVRQQLGDRAGADLVKRAHGILAGVLERHRTDPEPARGVHPAVIGSHRGAVVVERRNHLARIGRQMQPEYAGGGGDPQIVGIDHTGRAHRRVEGEPIDHDAAFGRREQRLVENVEPEQALLERVPERPFAQLAAAVDEEFGRIGHLSSPSS